MNKSAARMLALLILMAGAGFAQTVEITGRVIDVSGAVIPGTEIAVLSVDTGVRRPVTSNETGYYSVPSLPPGHYTITAQKSGFKPVVRSGVRLEVGQIARIDFVMELGAVSESMEVVGEVSLVATEEASVGTVVGGQKVHELPLNGRNVFSLITLTPGASSKDAGSPFGRLSNVSGDRANTSAVLLDGAGTNSADQMDTKITPPLEAIAEFKVQTASFEAEFGAASSVVNVVTKSGTNAAHGSLFEFVRNDAFDANQYFFNANAKGRQKLRYNQFGGAIGGPVYIPRIYDGRNRSFFFFASEYTRQKGVGLVFAPGQSGDSMVTTTIPTLLERAGNFSESSSSGGPQPIFDPNTTTPSGKGFSRQPFPESLIPASRFHPIAVNILKQGYPEPNAAGRANNFTSGGGAGVDMDSYTMRGDHYFTPENRLTLRYSRSTAAIRNVVAWPGYPSQHCGSASCNLLQDGIVHSVALRDTHSMRTNILNEFTYALLYNTLDLKPASGHQGWSQRLGFKNTAPYLFPTLSISGYSGLYGGNLSVEGDVDHMFSDNVTWIRGAHNVKAGYDFRRLYYRKQAPGGNTAGNLTFDVQPTKNPLLSGAAAGGNGVASLLLGIPSTSRLDVNELKWAHYWHYHAGFVQDKWKVSPKLTLTYGLRWDYTRPAKERRNRMSVFNLDTLEMNYMGENGFRETAYEGDFKNLAPRVGFAYSPGAHGRTAIRGAFGLFYTSISDLGTGSQLGFTANSTWQTTDGGITYPLTLSDAFPLLTVGRGISPLTSVSTIGPRYPTPVVNQWTLSIQHGLFADTLLDVTYVGKKGTHLSIGDQQLNQVPANLLGPGDAQSRRPYPTRGNITYTASPVGNSVYHGVYIKMERRLSQGLSLLGWYSLAKSIDSSSGYKTFLVLGTTMIQDHHNIAAERSISTFDRTHTAVITGIYELPFGKGKTFGNQGGVLAALAGGWQMNGILTLWGGLPLSMGTAQNLTGSLGGGSRPNRLRSGVLSSSEQSITMWFDPSAFAQPAQFTFGNTSRTEPDLRGPGTAAVDFSLYRNMSLAERVKLQIRAEAFNALNRVNFYTPNTTIGSAGVATITSAAAARIIQLGARVVF
jgi:hypothetical protein